MKDKTSNPMELVELLKGHSVYIQTHNFPDPDALASAYGLEQFLKYYGVSAKLCYDGKIDKISSKKMLLTFGIEILPKEELTDMQKGDYIVTVDSQKHNSNITDFIGNAIACVDHHPTFIPCKYKYKDVRIVGACSTLIADYFARTNTPMDENTASVLLYGMKMDTANFTRGTTDLDIEMFAYLHKRADAEKMQVMSTNVIEFDDLKAYAAAIRTIRVYDRTGFAKIPFHCQDAVVAMVSDFILALDEVDIAVVYAAREDGFKFSVRSELPTVSAGIITQKALASFGSGGGHSYMAGGIITKDEIAKLGGQPDVVIKEAFLKTIEQERLKKSIEKQQIHEK